MGSNLMVKGDSLNFVAIIDSDYLSNIVLLTSFDHDKSP